MTSQSSDPDQPEDEMVLAWHREMDRLLEFWDDEPTHEKWRKGQRWT